MEARDGLEAALAASWDRDTLAVYADELQASGDPRGELIVLDLELEQRSSAELVARRASLMTAWLGRLVPSDPHQPWIGDSFRLGFVEDLVLDGNDPNAEARLATMLDSPLAPYLKRVTIRGDAAHVARVIGALGGRRHGWLTELAVRAWSGGCTLADDPLAELIAATPRLGLLDVQGAGTLTAFPHPALRRLRVTGWNALVALFPTDDSDLPTLVGVGELDFAFYEPYDPEHYVLAPQLPRTYPPLLLPALRVLDLTRNEIETLTPGGYYDDPDVDYDAGTPQPTQLTALGLLGSLALKKQLTHVKLPSLRDDGEFTLLANAVTKMPALEEIEIRRGHYYRAPDLPNSRARFVRPPPWPWPRLDRVAMGERIHVIVPGSRSGDSVPIADAVVVMERRFEELPADIRYAWTRFWVFVDELGKSEWKSDASGAWTEARGFPADILVAALETCEVGGSGGWRELRDELRFRRPMPAGAMVTIHRER